MDTIHRTSMQTHDIRLTTPYGDTVASECVPDDEFPAALRRFYNRAMQRANSIVVLDGISHPRNSFLEFVREYNENDARSSRVALQRRH